MKTYSKETHEVLASDSLLSKFGFHDGNQLDWLLHDLELDCDKQEILILAIKKFLLPELKQEVIIEEIQNCLHNPIRAISINGIPVAEYTGKFDPEYVIVSREEIIKLIT